MSRPTAFVLLIVILSSAAIAVVGSTLADTASQPADPVLEFYCRQSASAFKAADPLVAGLNFSLRVTSVYQSLSRRGRVTDADTTVARLFFSFGKLDSQTVEISGWEVDYDSILAVPDIFTGAYIFNFFPNDTGGKDIAIGFDSRSLTDAPPDGIAVIDRNRFILRRLYLYYPSPKGFRRYTKRLKFIDVNGFVFPESTIVNASENGVLFTEYFRQITTIDQIFVIP